MEQLLDGLLAGLSALAAGLLFGPHLTVLTRRWAPAGRQAPIEMILRLIATITMLGCGYASVHLFGDEDATSSYVQMMSALWLPQVLLSFALPRDD